MSTDSDATMRQFNPSNPDFSILSGSARRVADLLNRVAANPGSPIVAPLDDLLGALYCLVFALDNGFKGKAGASELKPVIDRANQIAKGEIKDDGNWMAGFHFNSAMFRISAILDRLPKALAGSHEGAVAAYSAKRGQTWSNKKAHAIRTEVNTVKHDDVGLWAGRNADMATALSAIDELLDLAETLTP